MSGQIKVNQVQLGDSATATQNFVLQTNVDGTAKLARGNAGATTQDILTVDAGGKVTLNTGIAINGATGLTVYTAQTTPLQASGTQYVASHSLGVVPSEVSFELIFLVADAGYSVGDIVTSVAQWTGTASSPNTMWRNTTNVGLQVSASTTVMIQNKTTGAAVTPTAANWAYRFKLRTS
jgi:hypothetical protein